MTCSLACNINKMVCLLLQISSTYQPTNAINFGVLGWAHVGKQGQIGWSHRLSGVWSLTELGQAGKRSHFQQLVAKKGSEAPSVRELTKRPMGQ